jgi:hypothetical protein
MPMMAFSIDTQIRLATCFAADLFEKKHVHPVVNPSTKTQIYGEIDRILGWMIQEVYLKFDKQAIKQSSGRSCHLKYRFLYCDIN